MTYWSATDRIAAVLVIVGAINWGLVGLFGFNLVQAPFGSVEILERAVYVIVALAGLWLVRLLARSAASEPITTPTVAR